MVEVFRASAAFRMFNGLLVCTLLSSCSQAAQTQESELAYTRPAGWKTVCLGRFLLDLPPSAELGAAEAEYKKVYSLKGINAVAAWGTVQYGSVEVVETTPAGRAGFNTVRSGIPGRKPSPEVYQELIQARKDDVQYVLDQIANSPEKDAANWTALLNSRKEALQRVIQNAKMSGEAMVNDPNGFAVQSGSHYVLGFFEAQDQRTRTFAGDQGEGNSTSPGLASEYRRLRATYHPRVPTAIPTTPGFCTYYGFIDEPTQPEANVRLRVPIQIKQYPNLIFVLDVAPAQPDGPSNIQKFPEMDAGRNDLDKIGVKRTHGPKAVQILGTPGRTYAQEYGDNCSSTSCRPADQAYDMEARTFGDASHVYRPKLVLLLTAATADDYKRKRPAQPKGFNVPDRPALSGHVPPPFEVGQELFEQVLRSIRPRPGAIAGQGAPEK